jgi:hypothetical protein
MCCMPALCGMQRVVSGLQRSPWMRWVLTNLTHFWVQTLLLLWDALYMFRVLMDPSSGAYNTSDAVYHVLFKQAVNFFVGSRSLCPLCCLARPFLCFVCSWLTHRTMTHGTQNLKKNFCVGLENREVNCYKYCVASNLPKLFRYEFGLCLHITQPDV